MRDLIGTGDTIRIGTGVNRTGTVGEIVWKAVWPYLISSTRMGHVSTISHTVRDVANESEVSL